MFWYPYLNEIVQSGHLEIFVKRQKGAHNGPPKHKGERRPSASYRHSVIQGFSRLTTFTVAFVDLHQLVKFTKPYTLKPQK